MIECKPVSTPTNSDIKPTSASLEDVCNQKEYQAVVGSLLYLSTRTRQDIAFAVGIAARFCTNPSQENWTAVKRILRYLKGTVTLGLVYKRNGSTECTGYADAGWVGDILKSTSGSLFLLGGAAITWKSNKQTCIALSTAEAEYVALSAAAQEAVWLQQLTSDLLNRSAFKK